MKPTKTMITVDTDLAWEKLHGRLEQEGLLPEQQDIQPARAFPVWMKWAASFLLLIVAGSVFILLSNRPEQVELLALTNEQDDQTLVKFLEDGSVIYLAANTTLEYPQAFGAKERRVKMAGEAYFEVQHNPEKPFRVDLDNALIEVLGTSFNIKRTGENDFDLFVEKGLVQVEVRGQARDKVLVEPGEVLSVREGHFSKYRNNDLELTLWRQNRMHFKDESLANVLSVINRNYQASLELGDPSLASRQMTVTFFNNSLPTIIELISLSMNLQAQVQPDSSIVFTAR
ncbi:MAG: FecR domain-containing protein [Bacteroides sp.]|jgi:ferric-dicitrate binding protein FerR (iron transport regulator)|nr:FecR domain-containing protein [Bacteroides sp.]